MTPEQFAVRELAFARYKAEGRYDFNMELEMGVLADTRAGVERVTDWECQCWRHIAAQFVRGIESTIPAKPDPAPPWAGNIATQKRPRRVGR